MCPLLAVALVLPNTRVAFGSKDGLGCDPNDDMNHHFTVDERAGKPEPDRH
jgi:hypothetical protein